MGEIPRIILLCLIFRWRSTAAVKRALEDKVREEVTMPRLGTKMRLRTDNLQLLLQIQFAVAIATVALPDYIFSTSMAASVDA